MTLGPTHIFFALVLTSACGPTFVTNESADLPSERVTPAADAAPGADVGRSGCGGLRTGDAPTYDREVCFVGAAFAMGSDSANLGKSFADHTPAHGVTLSTYRLDAYEVTVGRYRACVAAGACVVPEAPLAGGCTYAASYENDALPLTCATWSEAGRFCAWDEGRRLPTEAEWEYAARGSDESTYPWGAEFSCPRAVIGGYAAGPCPDNMGALPKPVGSAGAGRSIAGVFDLVGNAAEWVHDWAGSYPTGAVRDPQGPETGAGRVLRGGSWASTLPVGLGFARTTSPPATRGPWGFRCAMKP